jgi:signal transduction histidine kinase
MRQIRRSKRQRPASWWPEPLPPDARDPDIIRARQSARRAAAAPPLEVDGVPGPLDPDTGVMLDRIEALTSVARHAGRGVRVTVRLVWSPGGAEAPVVDSGGDGVDAGLPSSSSGLTGMAGRAALKAGHRRAGHSGGGIAVRLRLPAAERAS